MAAHPVETLAERLAAAIDERTAAVLTSAVFFETARIVPRLGELAAECRRRETPLLVDAYHALGVLPFSLPALGLESALVTGGGYKYLQLGEGNAFLRLPRGLDLRPVVTGWYAEFWTKTAATSWERRSTTHPAPPRSPARPTTRRVTTGRRGCSISSPSSS